MGNLKIKLIRPFLKVVFSGWHRGSVDQQRARQERMSRFNIPNPGISFQPFEIASLAAAWIQPDSPSGTILYLHGGAYTLGSIATHSNLAKMLAKTTSRRVLLIDYRLAPEHPFPAGLEDALSAYQWLLEQGNLPEEIIIAGDSAGGGLALATLLSLRDDRIPLPSRAVLFSPWTDLTLSGESITEKAAADFILNAPHLADMARLYAGDHTLNHPLISPLFANLTGLPPLLIQVGTDEILLEDSHRLAQLAEKAGVEVQLEIYEEMFHVFHMFPFFTETQQAFESISDLINRPTSLARIE